MNMVNTSKHHGAEKAIINALLKISEIVKKSAAGRLSEKSRPFVPQSSSTLGSGDVKHQVSAARQIWEERRCMWLHLMISGSALDIARYR